MMADPDNSRFIGGPLGPRAAWASLSIMAGSWALHGFGNFSVTRRKASTGRNPRTGEPMQIAASSQPKFRPGKVLKDAVQ